MFGASPFAISPLGVGIESTSEGSTDPVIVDVTAGDTSAVLTYTGTATHYRLNGGASVAIGASPHTITGLTADTEYTVELTGDELTWTDPYAFGTDNSATGGGGFAAVNLVGADCSQAASSGGGAITQVHALAAAACDQTAASGAASIGQTHVLTAQDCTQAASSGTGAVALDGVIALAGAACVQAASSSAGALSQVHALLAAACAQAAGSSTGVITIGDIDTSLSADWTYAVPRFGKPYAVPSFGKTYTAH